MCLIVRLVSRAGLVLYPVFMKSRNPHLIHFIRTPKRQNVRKTYRKYVLSTWEFRSSIRKKTTSVKSRLSEWQRLVLSHSCRLTQKQRLSSAKRAPNPQRQRGFRNVLRGKSCRLLIRGEVTNAARRRRILPSYLAAYVALIAVPSDRSPVVVCFTPPSATSRVTVRLLTGIGAGVYFDFSILSFQVPSELSAPKTTPVEIARTTSALRRRDRIVFSFMVLIEHRCPNATERKIQPVK